MRLIPSTPAMDTLKKGLEDYRDKFKCSPSLICVGTEFGQQLIADFEAVTGESVAKVATFGAIPLYVSDALAPKDAVLLASGTLLKGALSLCELTHH